MCLFPRFARVRNLTNLEAINSVGYPEKILKIDV